jgi:acyl-CoA thioesterase FadM
VGVNARDVLAADGYRFVADVPTTEHDYDLQGHLNNAAIVRLFNDLRIAYVQVVAGDWWPEMLQARGNVVVARELHVLYESEAVPGEELAGALRYAHRNGKAAIVEQRIVERVTGRPIARAWVVQLLACDGRAIDWPDEYFAAVEAFEGRTVERRARRGAPPWGPPP